MSTNVVNREREEIRDAIIARVTSDPEYRKFAGVLGVASHGTSILLFGEICTNDRADLNWFLVKKMRYDVRISVDINRIRREALDKIAETNPPLSRGLIIKYEPTIEYLIPAITAAFAGVGVSCEYANGIFSKWFTHLPEIRKKYKITPNSPIKQYENALSDLYHLYIKMARRYRTLHIDEILTLRLLPQILPQPIAEAVADCIHGVMDRRYMHRGYMNYYDWTNEGAFWNEVSITHYDMFGESEVTRASKPRQESWEACAIELHEERQDIIRAKMSTRKKSSSSSESSHDYERTSCWAGDDGW